MSGAPAMPQLGAQVEQKVIQKMFNVQDLTCSICLIVFKKPSVLKCSHMFCLKCIELWLRNNRSCPMCRFKITDPPVVCGMLEKLIPQIMAASMPACMTATMPASMPAVTNRRNTIGSVSRGRDFIPARPARQSNERNLSASVRQLNDRPPWR